MNPTMNAMTHSGRAPNSPATGLLLSDCLGIVAGCAIFCAIVSRLPRGSGVSWQAVVSLGFMVCVAAFAAGPAVLLPRILRWGRHTLTSSERGWLVIGIIVDVVLSAAMLSDTATDFAIILIPWLVTFLVAGFNMSARFGSSQRWTHKFSVTLCLASWVTLLLLIAAAVVE